jgi:hypothetical protein
MNRTIYRTTKKRPRRKAKKSFTLSSESVAFLDALRKKRQAPSTSSVLEEILQAVRREQERVAVEKAVWDYYGSLSDADAGEHIAWGEFALREFPNEVA